MANRGETKSQKSISAPSVRYFKRKANVFTAQSRPGPHSKETSVPLSFALINLLELAANLKEAKRILNQGKIKVNGKIRKTPRFPVGILDIIGIEGIKKKYRALLDKKGRLVMKEADAKTKEFKISKVVAKRKVKGGKTWITTNDGLTIGIGKEKVSVDDSVKITLPEGKIEEVLSLEKGNTVFIIGGTHVGEITRIEDITPGTLQRKKLISLIQGENKFQTVARNVIVIGKAKPEIEVLEAE